MQDLIKKVYWDTSVWIAWDKNENGIKPLCTGILKDAEAGKIKVILSTLILAEFAPQNPEVEKLIERYLSRSSFIVVAVSRRIAEDARALVRDYKLQGADAVHVATALYANASCFHTLDIGILKKNLKIPGIRIELPDWIDQSRFLYDMEQIESKTS